MKVGIEAWLDKQPDKSKKIGLLSHQAALLSDGSTSAQALRAYYGKNLVKIFGPEHGYFGLAGAGEKVAESLHPVWKIPLFSLYGEFRKPTPEMLLGLDLLYIDLQDIGVRCYTYLATLKLALEACAEAGVEAIVCERPVPLPNCVDGAIATPEFFSFVAPCELPMVYGLTQTETAAWLKLPHTPAPMENYEKTFRRPADAPFFVPPSPAIRSWETAAIYPATVFCEALPQFDVARNSAWAFQVLHADFIRGEELAEVMNCQNLKGVKFFDDTQSEAAGGIRVAMTNPAVFRPVATGVSLLHILRELYGEDCVWHSGKERRDWFDKLYGTDDVRLKLESGILPEFDDFLKE